MRTGAIDRSRGVSRTTCALLAAVLAVSVTFPAFAREAVVVGELGAELDAYLTRLEGVGFSGVAAVMKDGELILEGGYGLADREARRPAGPSTVISIASITKQFTGAAILALQEQGKLSVQDRLDRWFPGVPADKAGITLHQLLTHSAGFPGAIGDDFDLSATRDAFLADALAVDLLFEPGSGHEYSNVGYSLLGIIVELASGMGYEQFLHDRLFASAGLEHTGYLLPGYRQDELAVGYRDGKRWGTVIGQPMLEDGPSWHLRANGGIHSTAGEMVRWVAALQDDSVLSKASREQLFAPHVDEGSGDSWYGYGWVTFQRPDGKRFLAHNGGNGIFSADCRLDPQDGVILFVASNLSGFAPVDPVSEDLAAICLGEMDDGDWPPEVIAMDGNQLHRYAGIFLLPSGERVEIEVGSAGLVMRGNGQGSAALFGGLDLEQSAAIILRSGKAVGAWLQGDVAPLMEWWGGEATAEELSGTAEKLKARWEGVLGAYRGIGDPSVGVGRDGPGCAVPLRFEDGSRYLVLRWRDGRIGGIGASPEPPWEDGGRLEVFPLSEQDFVSYSLSGAEPVEVVFRVNRGDGLVSAFVIRTSVRPVVAERYR